MDKIKNKLLSNDGVLFLQGVFKKDCKRMEDMFREKIIVENTNDRETKLYDKIPVIFTSLNDWFKSTPVTDKSDNRLLLFPLEVGFTASDAGILL